MLAASGLKITNTLPVMNIALDVPTSVKRRDAFKDVRDYCSSGALLVGWLRVM